MQTIPGRAYRIDHPSRTTSTLVYGWTPDRGHFVDVVMHGTTVFTSRARTLDERYALQHVLLWTLEHGFCTPDEIAVVRRALAQRTFTLLSSRRLRSLAMLLVRLERASTTS